MLDCQLEREYTEEEWRAFVDCARRSFASGEALHNEFSAKIAAHDVREARVERSLSRQGSLLIYEHAGRPRLAAWHPGDGTLRDCHSAGRLDLQCLPDRGSLRLCAQTEGSEVAVE